jgi:hypothetical protein
MKPIKILKLILTFFVIFNCFSTFGAISDSKLALLKNAATLWESEGNLPTCEGFPTKRNPDHAENDSRYLCNDGDMTLFSGLLCAAGDKRGCDAVFAAKNSEGRWFRSPRRSKDSSIDQAEAKDGVASFSPDMALGVQLYLATTKDIMSGTQWYQWLDRNRPCWLFSEPNCGLPSNVNDMLENVFKVGRIENIRGWPRFCRDDVKEMGCTMRPGDLAILEETRIGLGIKDNNAEECNWKNSSDIFNLQYWSAMLNFENITKGGFFKLLDINCNKAAPWVASGALLNKPGFPQHLVAVEILLAKKLGIQDPLQEQSARILTQNQPNNPFFSYLVEGATDKVADLVIKQCPSTQAEIDQSKKYQWSWERNDSEHANKNSVLWDCVFMVKLLGI